MNQYKYSGGQCCTGVKGDPLSTVDVSRRTRRRVPRWRAAGNDGGHADKRPTIPGPRHHPDVARAKCMEDVWHILARKTLVEAKSVDSHSWNRHEKREKEKNSSREEEPLGSLVSPSRYVVGVIGPPGSGKSTLAKQVVHIINSIQGEECAVMLPMDGFHYYKWQLDVFDDPDAAHARRGAHWTFDAEGFVKLVERVVNCPDEVILAPSFDHGSGDPVEKDISIERHHSIVIVEGNYLLLDVEPWSRLDYLLDQRWYIDCKIEEAMRRVYRRQTRNGLRPKEARRRIDTNDRLNAREIALCASRADMIVPSLKIRRIRG